MTKKKKSLQTKTSPTSSSSYEPHAAIFATLKMEDSRRDIIPVIN
jgi:hypothetical protein